MRTGTTAVSEDVGAVAARVFESVSQHRQVVESKVVVDALDNCTNRIIVPSKYGGVDCNVRFRKMSVPQEAGDRVGSAATHRGQPSCTARYQCRHPRLAPRWTGRG